jgi:hypothetical protein
LKELKDQKKLTTKTVRQNKLLYQIQILNDFQNPETKLICLPKNCYTEGGMFKDKERMRTDNASMFQHHLLGRAVFLHNQGSINKGLHGAPS